MKKYFLFLIVVSITAISCTNPSQKKETQQVTDQKKADTASVDLNQTATQTTFTVSGVKPTSIQNGECIEYYDNKVIKIRGMMKDGKRDGVWKSWYEDGTPWSETTFSEGKKKGKTTTWYENRQKRYEGYYNMDQESGKWTFWDEKGKLIQTKDFDKK